VSAVPWLAGPEDLPRLISGVGVHYEWPPPGTTVVKTGFPEPWVLVLGEPTSGSPDDWWVTTLGNVVLGDEAQLLEFLAGRGVAFVGPVATFAGVAGHWPVIYQPTKGRAMRWIASTVRGTLGGTEQFQFGVNWGLPGADPDITEAQALTLATSLRDKLAVELLVARTGGTAQSMFSSDVKFTEVGVTQKTQTDATAADGSGGNLNQDFDTQWAAYAVGSQPTGTAGGFGLPFEVALALTLNTDKRGASGRGRIYLPSLGTTAMAAGGRFNPIICNLMGAFIGAWFHSVTLAHTYKPLVVSRRRIVLNEVKSITVGAVPDSQRRRRRSQVEANTVAWTAP